MLKSITISVISFTVAACAGPDLTLQRRIEAIERNQRENNRLMQVMSLTDQRLEQNNFNSRKALDLANQAYLKSLRAEDNARSAREAAQSAKDLTDQIEIVRMPGGGIIRPVPLP